MGWTTSDGQLIWGNFLSYHMRAFLESFSYGWGGMGWDGMRARFAVKRCRRLQANMSSIYEGALGRAVEMEGKV